MVSKFQSLKKNREFQYVYQQGRSKANRCFVMLVRENHSDDNRVGISVSKKVGNSIVRHRIARVVREVMRLHWDDVKKGCDIVIIARKPAVDSGYEKFESALIHLLKLHHLYVDNSDVKQD